MSDKGVYRTAPAAPGLLIMKVFVEQPWLHWLINDQDKSRLTKDA